MKAYDWDWIGDVRASLRRAEMTQDQLAYYLGVTPRTVRRWLSGKAPVSRMAQLAIFTILPPKRG